MSKVFEALAALAAVGTFIVTFLDSYEIKFRIRRRARTVRDEGRRALANRLRSTARHRVSPVYLGVYHPVYQAAPRQANR